MILNNEKNQGHRGSEHKGTDSENGLDEGFGLFRNRQLTASPQNITSS